MSDKFCKDCKHFVSRMKDAPFCARPECNKALFGAYLVFGDTHPGAYCIAARAHPICGPEGKLWEPADKCCDAIADEDGILMHGADCRLNKGWNREPGE